MISEFELAYSRCSLSNEENLPALFAAAASIPPDISPHALRALFQEIIDES
jgi:hypothetical protein